MQDPHRLLTLREGLVLRPPPALLLPHVVSCTWLISLLCLEAGPGLRQDPLGSGPCVWAWAIQPLRCLGAPDMG